MNSITDTLIDNWFWVGMFFALLAYPFVLRYLEATFKEDDPEAWDDEGPDSKPESGKENP